MFNDRGYFSWEMFRVRKEKKTVFDDDDDDAKYQNVLLQANTKNHTFA